MISDPAPGKKYERIFGGSVVVDFVAAHTEHIGHMVIYHPVDEEARFAKPLMVFLQEFMDSDTPEDQVLSVDHSEEGS